MEIQIETLMNIKNLGKTVILKCYNCDKQVTFEKELRHTQCPKCKKNFYHLIPRYKYCVKGGNHEYLLKECETGDNVKLFQYNVEVIKIE